MSLQIHEAVLLKLKEGEAEIDRLIVELVQTIDGIDGIKTTVSCQGNLYEGEEQEFQGCGVDQAYIEFAPHHSSTKRCRSFLWLMLGLIGELYEKKCFSVTHDENDMGGFFEARLYFDGFAINWNPSIYPYVLYAAQQAARIVSGMD